MKLVILDAETYWDNDYTLKKLTIPEYVMDRRFELHFFAAWEPFKEPRPHIVEAADIPTFLARYPPTTTTIVSHNALFDHSILAWRYGFVPARLQDTLGMARAILSLPRYDLDTVGQFFGYSKKDDALYRTQGLHTHDIKARGLWPALTQYACRDVLKCTGIYINLLDSFPLAERKVMDLVLRCAVEPSFHADVDLLATHLMELRQRKAQLIRDCGYDKISLMSTAKFQSALEKLGVAIEYKVSPTGHQIPAFAKTDQFMTGLQEYSGGPDDETNFKVQVLAAARLAHKSTIEETRTERFLTFASLPWANDQPMLPIGLNYAGAHTHRLSGAFKSNFQNLVRDQTRSKLRTALTAPSLDYKVVSVDLSSIEARLTAVFCGQDDLVEQFCNGVDVYASFASRVFGYPVDKSKYPIERWCGKQGILGCGFGCGFERFYRMVTTAARQNNIKIDFTKDMALEIVRTYRRTYPHIKNMWRRLETYLHAIILNDNTNQTAVIDPVKFSSGQILLPNGLTLRYDVRNPDPNLWAGKILENIIQALARNIIMEAALRIKSRGYRFAHQVHDELIYIVHNNEVEHAKSIIMEEATHPPAWMPTAPIAAEIGVGQNYGGVKS